MKYVIEVGTVNATVLEGSVKVLSKLLRIVDPTDAASASARLGLCEGVVEFVDPATGEFPAGLVWRARKRLEKRGHTVEVVYTGGTPEISPCDENYCIGIAMRDYQVASVNAVLEHKRGLLWLVTNAGKTSVIAAMCGKFVREGRMKVLVVVPTAWLLKQTPDDMKGFLGPDVKVERAGGGHVFTSADVLVGTYQTLVRGVPDGHGQSRNAKLQDFIAKCGAVIVDEAHKIGSPSISAIMRACTNAHYRVGLTGTVDKRDHTVARENDDKAIYHRWMAEKYTGPVLYKVTTDELVERGISAKPTVYVVNDRAAYGPPVATPRPSFNGRPTNIYQEVFDKAVIGDKRFRRSVAIVTAECLAQGKPPIVFSHSVAYLQRLSVTFAKFGIPCELAVGSTSMRTRVDIVKRFERDQNFALLSSNIFNEGFSINSIRAVILAGTRKSPVELLQRIGRGLRKKDEDNTVVIIDFDPIHSTLLHKHFRVREAAYREQGFDVNYITSILAVRRIY